MAFWLCFAEPKGNKQNKILQTIWHSSHHPTQTKTHGFPATTLHKQNTWLSSHHLTDSHKTHGFPATTQQKQNTWLSSHHPTQTKHMAFQPPPYTNKTHGFPATTLHKQNTWLSSHHFQKLKLFPNQVWLKSMENACLEAFGCPASAKLKGSGHQFFLFS